MRRKRGSAFFHHKPLSTRVLRWRSREESNFHLRFRKPLFYPLNYGSVGRPLPCSPTECKQAKTGSFFKPGFSDTKRISPGCSLPWAVRRSLLTRLRSSARPLCETPDSAHGGAIAAGRQRLGETFWGGMVRARGIEPPRGCPHMNLNHARLPIPPRARRRKEITLPDPWQSNFGTEIFTVSESFGFFPFLVSSGHP